MSVENFRRALAENKGDNRLWTAEDALADLLADVRAGKVSPSQIAIHYLTKNEDGTLMHRYQAAGLTYPDHIALLNVSLKRLLDSWLA